ncbi:hypothetical protein [Paenibacillus ginsengihumi]|uniref:hypothetical protein n=1 Tax=Paenibacillus ginsengihumi TaxID=431596 RepID=UPI0012EB3C8F|nr:hypothetical protein [Paenibacillus ginsengihumi]
MMKRFLAYYKPYKKALAADLLFAALASAAVLAYPLLVNYMTTMAISDQGIQLPLLLKAIAVFALLMIVEYVSHF